MNGVEVPGIFVQFAHYALMWIGFGTLVGLAAKAILPGRDPGGALATVLLGVTGSIIGAGTLAFFSDSLRVSPLSPIGLVVAILGAALLLIMYRVLSGRLFREVESSGVRVPHRSPRGRRKVSVIEEP